MLDIVWGRKSRQDLIDENNLLADMLAREFPGEVIRSYVNQRLAAKLIETITILEHYRRPDQLTVDENSTIDTGESIARHVLRGKIR
jgi:hypothetical protein